MWNTLHSFYSEIRSGDYGQVTNTSTGQEETLFWIHRHMCEGFRRYGAFCRLGSRAGVSPQITGTTLAFILFYFMTFSEDTFSPWGYIYLAILWLWVNDKYQCSCSPEDHLIVKCRVKKVNLSWEVPNLKIDKGAVGNIFPAYLVSALQEQCFVGRHFVKDNFLNRWLAASPQAHEQDSRLHFSAEGVAEVQNWRNHKMRMKVRRFHSG